MPEWAPFATRRNGPAWKVGYSCAGETGPKRGDVKHSAEGGWGGIHSVLSGSRQASWHFTVGYDRVEQHYPISAHCWHAGDTDNDGGVAANIDLVGIEHLGVAGEPLTPYQVKMTVEISRFCAKQSGRSRYERFDGWSPDERGLWLLVEHNEVSNQPTDCPSGRVPWASILQQLEEGEDMADTEARNRLAAAGIFAQAQALALQGKKLPDGLEAKIRFLLGG